MRKRFCLNWGKGAKVKVERLLEGGIDINDPIDTYGYTLLHHAVEIATDAEEGIRDESEAVTKLLLDKGADINAFDCCGRTPLMIASSSFNVNAAKLLIDKGCNLTLNCNYGKNALHYTVLNPNIVIARMIFEKNGFSNFVDCVGECPYEESLKLGNLVMSKYLNNCKSLDSEKNNNVSDLHRAAFWGNVKQLRCLILDNNDLNCRDILGNTPLITSVRSGKLEITRMLLDSGADIDLKDNDGNSALHWACILCLGDIVRLILQYGSNPSCSNLSEQTPFDCATVSMKGEVKVPYGVMFITSPVVNHLLDYGVCKHVEINKLLHSTGHRIEKDDKDTYPSLVKFIISNDLRRTYAGLRSVLPFIRNVNRNFFPKALRIRFDISIHDIRLDIMKRINPQFHTDCKREIAIMKTISLTNKLSLFDIIQKSADDVLHYISSDLIQHLIFSDDCADNLPIYWGIVQSKLEVLLYRRSLLESSQHFFSFLKPLLPFECVEIILKYITAKEMKWLRSIVYRIDLESAD